jgi:hypothetical protein
MDLNNPVMETSHSEMLAYLNSTLKNMYVFYGRVLPERRDVDIERRFFFQEMHNEFGVIKGRVHFEVSNSQVVACVYNDQIIEEIYTFRNGILELISFNLHALGFVKGIPLDVDITCVFDSTKGETIFFETTTIKEAKPISAHKEEALLNLQIVDDRIPMHIRIALSDYNAALRSVQDTGFHCYRVVESLMHCHRLLNDGDITKNARPEDWQNFLNFIRTPESVKRKIESHAWFERHGKPNVISSDNREWLLEYTWYIIDNFVTACIEMHNTGASEIK